MTGCQGMQMIKDGHVQAMITGYPTPVIMWFRDIQRTSRITTDNVYQLLTSGNVSISNHMIFTMCI